MLTLTTNGERRPGRSGAAERMLQVNGWQSSALAGASHARRVGNLAHVDWAALHAPRPTDEPIAALKARIELVELAGRHTTLKRRGREWWGRCPLHGERTPSFKVNPQ